MKCKNPSTHDDSGIPTKKMRPNNKDINYLPDHVLESIFSYLSSQDMQRTIMWVCKKWGRVSINFMRKVALKKFNKRIQKRQNV